MKREIRATVLAAIWLIAALHPISAQQIMVGVISANGTGGGGGGSNPAVNGSNTCHNDAGAVATSISCTLPSTPTATTSGIYVSYSLNDFAAVGASGMNCTDNQTPANTYTPPTNNSAFVSPSYRIRQFLAVNITASGTFTITCAYSGSGSGNAQMQIGAMEVTNATAADVSATNTGSSASVSATLGSTTATNTAIVQSAFWDTAGLTITSRTICGVAATAGPGVPSGSPTPLMGLSTMYKSFTSAQSSCAGTQALNNGPTWSAVMMSIK